MVTNNWKMRAAEKADKIRVYGKQYLPWMRKKIPHESPERIERSCAESERMTKSLYKVK
jgi:hypothetical protein